MRSELLALPTGVLLAALAAAALGQDASDPAAGARLLTGAAAFGDWRADAPLIRRKITVDDLPKPYATHSASNFPRAVSRPPGASPKVPPGFTAELFASGLEDPRALVVAPNGDIFVAESGPGRVRVLRAGEGESKARANSVFATGLQGPFGMAFHPPGPDPQWLYVANTASVVRYPYRNGDLKARASAQVVVPTLAGAGRARRAGRAYQHGLGAAWGYETDRADVLAFDPEGKNRRVFATGLRNCVGLAIAPTSGTLWCSVNERDGLGDDLVPDFITRVRDGAFFGWPWYYLGANEDPRHRGARPDLKGKVTVPDVLIQAHSASMRLAFYQGGQFPAQYRGDAFAAEHGSWNRSKRTGYKVIRVRLRDGVPTGEYEDFVTGFVINDGAVWGRPVGVAVARDGALLVSEDGNGTIWRISYRGG